MSGKGKVIKQSLRPQQVERGAWYYEEGRKIELIVYLSERHPKELREGFLHIKIPARKLEKTLARMPRA